MYVYIQVIYNIYKTLIKMLLVIYCVIEIIVLLIDFTMTGKQCSFNLFCPFPVAGKPTGIICLICVKPILYFISCLNQAPIISYILLRAQTLKGITESTYLTSNLQVTTNPSSLSHTSQISGTSIFI